jgi:HK97 family phage major capsid protein/HK97 family phage prohead protease
MTEELKGEAVPQRLDIDVVRSASDRSELRASSDEGDSPIGTMVGEFSVFGDWYEINSMFEGHFIERTAPGAFKRTINNRSNQSPVRVILEHGFDPTVADKPLGIPRVLEERANGVYAETPLFDTSYNRDLAPALKSGAYGQSFRFQVVRDEWVEPEAEDGFEATGNPAWDNLPQRTITEVRLMEFGPTIWPASPSTNGTTGLRSATDQFYEQLARRDSSAYEAAIRSIAPTRRMPETPVEPDPQDQHSDPDPAPVEHVDVEDSPVRHSEETTSQPNPTTSKEEETKMSELLTVEERSARVSEIDARLAEIDKDNAGAKLRSELQAEWDSLIAEREEHEDNIRAANARAAYLQRSVDATVEKGEVRVAPSGKREAPAVHVSGGKNIYDTAQVRRDYGFGEEAARVYRDNAKRAIEIAKFPGTKREDSQARAMTILEQVDDAEGSLAKRFLNTGSDQYDRAFGKAAVAGSTSALTSEELRALSMGTDAAGGFAVPFQLDPTVIATDTGVINPIRDLARVVQITGKAWEGVTSAGITVSRFAEAAEATDNSPSFAQPTVSTSRVQGFVPFSYELEYSWSNLRQELGLMLSEAKALEEAVSFITGTGTAPAPQGVVTGATVAATTATTGAFTRNDLYNTVTALPPRYRRRAQWLADVSFFNAVRELQESGFDIWAPLADGIGQRLLGYPAVEDSAMPDYSLTIGTKLALFGDFSQFIIAERVGMSVELIPQVFGSNGRPTGQRGIFAIWMNGSKVIVPDAFRLVTAK